MIILSLIRNNWILIMKIRNLLIVTFIGLLTSCGGGQPKPLYVYNTNPKYTWGYAEFYGAYYAGSGNDNNVISLSLFSDSLKINDIGNLIGIGQYLFLEDVFVTKADTLLPVGIYSVNETGLPFTVAPGKNDTVDNEVYPIGACISYYEDNTANSTLKLITDGSFTVSRVGNNYNVIFDLKTSDKKALKGSFSATLPHIDQSLVTPKSVIRNKLVYLR